MWIALGILGALVLLIAGILLLPVKLMLKNDEHNTLTLRYGLLWMTFGGASKKETPKNNAPKPVNPIVNKILEITGIGRLTKNRIEKNVQSSGLQTTVTDSYAMLVDFFRELVTVVKAVTISRLHLTIRCTGDDVDTAAIHYGVCCAATYSLLNMLQGLVKIRNRGRKVNLSCDPFGKEPVFRYDIVLKIRIFHGLSSFLRIILAEAKRASAERGVLRK